MIAEILMAAAAAAGPSRAPLFGSRVAYAPLRAKLKAAGEDESKVLRPARLPDLDALASGKRYKFVVRGDGSLAIAPIPADQPHNEYVHPILAGGEPVRTAGGLRVDRSGGKVASITVDQDSQAYCPSFESLGEAVRALEKLGAVAGTIRRENRPPACAPAL